MYVCTYVYVRMCICTYIYICIFIYVYMLDVRVKKRRRYFHMVGGFHASDGFSVLMERPSQIILPDTN